VFKTQGFFKASLEFKTGAGTLMLKTCAYLLMADPDEEKRYLN